LHMKIICSSSLILEDIKHDVNGHFCSFINRRLKMHPTKLLKLCLVGNRREVQP
jgi:hypothetical protein